MDVFWPLRFLEFGGCQSKEKMGSAAENGSTLMVQVEEELPLGLKAVEFPLENKRIGLVIVDEVNGFCTVGAGNLVRFYRFTNMHIPFYAFR